MDCKNCKNSVLDSDGFCSNCGARKVDNRLTFKYFFKEFSEKVLSVDNKLLKTIIHLFVKPDVVVKSYIDGVRKRYIDPFGFLLISITLSSISIYLMREGAIQSLENLNDTAGLQNTEGTKQMMNMIYDYSAIVTGISIPVYAFMSWIVFYNKKMYNYVEHVIIYLYTNAQFAIVNLIVVLVLYLSGETVGVFTSFGLMGFYLIYTAIILKKLFKLSFLQLIIKTLYFLLILAVVYVITSILFAVGMYLILGPEYFKQFAPQGKQALYDASSTLNCLSYKFL